MLPNEHEIYKDAALKTFTDKLQSGYYENVAELCTRMKKQCQRILGLERSGSQLWYVRQCEQVIDGIGQYISNRKNVYLPYVDSLADKVKDNHNCSTCSGSCRVNHEVYILELRATNDEVRKLLSKLNVMSLPLHADTVFPDEYRLLRASMTLLENNLTELFYLENTYLIPKIAEAQKQINAGSY